MRLLLIRHGETVDNVRQIYAGIRDSILTNHGMLQASRLGSYLASSNVEISRIFSSDLQRAFKTAESIRLAQSNPLIKTTKLELLREQDFGSYEGKPFSERPRMSDKKGQVVHLDTVQSDPTFKEVETKESMILRMKTFINSHLIELFNQKDLGHTVAVVAHGIILSYLWRGILQRFEAPNVILAPNIMIADRGMGLKFLGGWSNTGYMDLEIQEKSVSNDVSGTASSKVQQSTSLVSGSSSDEAQQPPIATQLADPTTLNGIISLPSQSVLNPVISLPLSGSEALVLTIKAVNCRLHLRDLKKTRGGIGSMKHDDKQATMDSFFKRRKIE